MSIIFINLILYTQLCLIDTIMFRIHCLMLRAVQPLSTTTINISVLFYFFYSSGLVYKIFVLMCSGYEIVSIKL